MHQFEILVYFKKCCFKLVESKHQRNTLLSVDFKSIYLFTSVDVFKGCFLKMKSPLQQLLAYIHQI